MADERGWEGGGAVGGGIRELDGAECWPGVGTDGGCYKKEQSKVEEPIVNSTMYNSPPS